MLQQFNHIALLAGLLTLITYFTTTLAEIKFIFVANAPLRQIFLSKSLYITLLAGLYAFWMISSFSWKTLLIGVLLILLCVPIYFFVIRNYDNH